MEILLIILAFFLGFVLVALAIPPIIKVAKAKNLFDSWDERKLHDNKIPPLGGIAIFIGFILSSIVATDGLSFDSLKYIIAAVILMFFVGLKDDLIVISVRKKLFVQILAALFIVVIGNLHFTNLHGMLGVFEIKHIISIPLSVFIIIVIINAYNLIDGIDGLASGLTILGGSVFGLWFYLNGNIQFSIMSFALVGSLSAFFIYNVFGKRNKLFMGDTGSLIIGLVISVFVIFFNEQNILKSMSYSIQNAPAVSFAVIIVPLIDTLRVMLIRIMQKRSPFSPDRNHIHHRLLLLVPNHMAVSLILIVSNAFFILLAFILNEKELNINIQFLVIFASAAVFSYLPSYIFNLKESLRIKETEII